MLRSRNLVRTQRAGTTVRYEIGDPAIWEFLDSARAIFDNQLVNVRSVLEDLARRGRARPDQAVTPVLGVGHDAGLLRSPVPGFAVIACAGPCLLVDVPAVCRVLHLSFGVTQLRGAVPRAVGDRSV